MLGIIHKEAKQFTVANLLIVYTFIEIGLGTLTNDAPCITFLKFWTCEFSNQWQLCQSRRKDFKHTGDVLRLAGVRRAIGLDKGNDFTSRCRKVVQDENGPRAELNLHLFQKFILAQTSFWGWIMKTCLVCLFVCLVFNLFFFMWFCEDGGGSGVLLWTTITSTALYWWDLRHSSLKTAQVKHLQLREVTTRWQVAFIRDKILANSCPLNDSSQTLP